MAIFVQTCTIPAGTPEELLRLLPERQKNYCVVRPRSGGAILRLRNNSPQRESYRFERTLL